MQSTDANSGAIVAKRVDSGQADTAEIRALAEAAGYEIRAEVTQTRREDRTYDLGRGKAEELAEVVAETGTKTVIIDNELDPGQLFDLGDLLPDGTEILDRYRLVLDIFERQAGTKRAKLQVERTRLEYDLPRVRREITAEIDGEDLAHDEKGGQRVRDIEQRIDALDTKLSDLADDTAARRERRREEGFEFVALVGYTNAGKSTLLHRLADDLDLDEEEASDHEDFDGTAEIEDRLFKTLDTTTRRATIDGRRTLATDTVGFVDDLPHEMVESFHGTLSETQDADCVVLVADASDDHEELRRKLLASLKLVEDTESLVVALNKADLLSESELAARTDAIADLAPDPVAISATEDENLGALCERVAAALPDLHHADLRLPNDDEAMSLVSWLYDRARVEDVTYGDDEVRIEFDGHPSVVERARAKADALAPEAR
ncbi:GTPase HflX [Halorussus halophilus]|uniref:GTPase HflX n=1 Tax=Halorussus halophilus TaxID=2650975 RepID=UPI0013010C00|nr:GTPase HflX [Halorussus halophilus]